MRPFQRKISRRAMLTRAAQEFVTPLSVAALAGEKVSATTVPVAGRGGEARMVELRAHGVRDGGRQSQLGTQEPGRNAESEEPYDGVHAQDTSAW